MTTTTPAGNPTSRFIPLVGFVALIWIVELFDQIVTDGNLDGNGILPRSLSGLDGVLWAPGLHGGIGHLISNTVPLLVLGGLVAMRGARRWIHVTLFVALVGGLFTWLFARPSIHIGASILVFGYITFLMGVGLFERRVGGMAIGVIVLVLYGGTLVSGVLPIQRGVSWEGHLFGALAGVAVAWILTRRSARQQPSSPARS